MPRTWRDLSPDPNDDDVIARRAAQLDGRWMAWTDTRDDLFVRLGTGAHVLDIGCTDEGVPGVGVLHARLTAAATECVGVDYDAEGLAALRGAGYEVFGADVTEPPPAALVARGPFDVITAGEIIEHLDSPAALLRFARPLLNATGNLVLSTPNPYAPHRMRAGWDREVWENADHVTYLFPSGMVELADRHSYELAQYGTVDTGLWSPPTNIGYSVRRWLKLHLRGDPLPRWYVPPYVPLLRRRNWPMMRETMVYVLRAVD